MNTKLIPEQLWRRVWNSAHLSTCSPVEGSTALPVFCCSFQTVFIDKQEEKISEDFKKITFQRRASCGSRHNKMMMSLCFSVCFTTNSSEGLRPSEATPGCSSGWRDGGWGGVAGHRGGGRGLTLELRGRTKWRLQLNKTVRHFLLRQHREMRPPPSKRVTETLNQSNQFLSAD